jgi:hypothetical protein
MWSGLQKSHTDRRFRKENVDDEWIERGMVSKLLWLCVEKEAAAMSR